MRIITMLPLAAAVLGLAGCGSYSNPIYGENGIINDRSQDYEKAQSADRLELPPSIRARTKPVQDSLKVPDAGITASARSGDFEVPRPEFFYAEAGSDKVNLKRQGSDKVIIVDEPVGDVWLQIQEFWRFNDVTLARSSPRDGVMETAWIEHQGDDLGFVDSWIRRLTFQDIEGPSSDKLRVSVRPVAEDFNRTSIMMQHIRVAEGDEDSVLDWQQSAEDVGYKTDLMFEMLRYLSKSNTSTGSHSLVAMKQSKRSAPQLGRDSTGNPALKISVAADQAWQQINRALDRTTIDVGDRDQQQGVVYMTYRTSTPFEDVEKMGFFEWLHSDRKSVTFETGDLGSALGFGETEVESGPSYSSAEAEQVNRSFEEDIAYDYTGSDELANREGFKIWFAGRVIYLFGEDSDARYNKDSGQYEHVGEYQLNMKRTANGVFLTVKTADGYAAPAVVADEILWEIKDQI